MGGSVDQRPGGSWCSICRGKRKSASRLVCSGSFRAAIDAEEFYRLLDGTVIDDAKIASVVMMTAVHSQRSGSRSHSRSRSRNRNRGAWTSLSSSRERLTNSPVEAFVLSDDVEIVDARAEFEADALMDFVKLFGELRAIDAGPSPAVASRVRR